MAEKRQTLLMSFKNKRILITAGPTWVPIDSVRVISNTASGETGILLAQAVFKQGARVTLFLGPVGRYSLNRGIRVINFKFFDELRSGLNKELRARKYDIIIHNAAVSDFKPQKIRAAKIPSKKKISLNLTPLPKISRQIRRLNPRAKLLIFKLETGVSQKELIKRAAFAQKEARADFAVANMLNPYKAFILNGKNRGRLLAVTSKNKLIERLIKLLCAKKLST